MSKPFPTGFLWGTASAAHQVEGNNVTSDAWVWENMPGSIYAEPSGDALDFLHRYDDDLRLVASLGFNSFRLGIEWARIEPEPGLISQAQIDHYIRVIDACHAHGLEPVVTLQHFTSPRWLIEHFQGWNNPDTAKRFADYAHRIATAMEDRVTWYCTINEVNTPTEITTPTPGLVSKERIEAIQKAEDQAASFFRVPRKDFAPFFPSAYTEKALAVVFDAHRHAVDAVHAARSENNVGITISMQEIVAEPGGEAIAADLDEKLNRRFLREVGTVGDFVAVQNYTRIRCDKDGPIIETGPKTGNGMVMAPTSLAATVREAAEVTGLPVLITEHGADLSTERDGERVAFIRESLDLLADEIAGGVEVLGYIHWSFADNFEWFSGYSGTFGLCEVDRETQTRTPRPSATVLGDIARANAL